ncbi:MAG: hypothetical protein ACREPR_10910 [Brasilonema sp.]
MLSNILNQKTQALLFWRSPKSSLRGKHKLYISSPDGQRIVTASVDSTAKVWRVGRLDELLARGCDWLQDYFVTHRRRRG